VSLAMLLWAMQLSASADRVLAMANHGALPRSSRDRLVSV
jgi:hypothetical protein